MFHADNIPLLVSGGVFFSVLLLSVAFMLYRREQVRRRRIHEKITRGEREVPSGSSPRVDDGSEGFGTG